MFLIITGCGKTPKLSYADAYDEIIVNYISLDSLSDITGISKSNLIRLRFNKSDDEKVTKIMSNILSALEKRDTKKISSIQSEVKKSPIVYDNNFSENKIDQSIRQKECAEIQQKQIENFWQNTPDIIFNYIDNDIDAYIEGKYSLLSAIPNTWNYYTKSDEEFMENFLKDFNWAELSSNCDAYYINRLNSFKDDLAEEQKVILGNNIEIPDFNVIPGENTFIIDEDLVILVKERTQSQIGEVSSDILWDLIIELIICAIITFMMNKAIDESRQRAIDRFLNNVRLKKGDGFWKNLGRATLHGLGVYGDYKEEVAAIRKRYDLCKYIVSIAIFILGGIVSWIFIIKPQLRIEAELNMELSSKIMESSNTLRINPSRVLSLYLNTNTEDQNYSEEKGGEIIEREIEVVAPAVIDVDQETYEGAIKDLYSIFYGTDNAPYLTYSESIKNKFKELGITSSLENPYTPSFQAEIDRMETLSQKVSDAGGGLCGFDSDILFASQGEAVDINLVVYHIEIIDKDNIIIKAEYSNGGVSDRVFKMKKIGKTFRIDDMDGTREFIAQECNDAEKFLNQHQEEANSKTEAACD